MSEKNDVRNCVLVILRSCVLVILVPWACFMFLVMLFAVWWIVKQIIIGPLICEQSTCPVQEHCEDEWVGFPPREMCGCYEDVWARPENCNVHAYPREDVKEEGLWAECGVYPHEADSSRKVYDWKIIDLRNLPACYHDRVPEFQRTAYDLKSKGRKGGAALP